MVEVIKDDSGRKTYYFSLDSDDNLIAFDSTKLHMASGGIERDGLSR